MGTRLEVNKASNGVVISGCSGGGKSTLLEQLGRCGFPVVDEPGRKIVREQLDTGGQALPWIDAAAFARRCIDVGRADLTRSRGHQWVFFGRSLVDAATALHHAAGEKGCSPEELRSYHENVFLTPPWRELYVGDDERQLGFDSAVAEYERLHSAYRELGYRITVLPRADVDSRIKLILDGLGIPSPPSPRQSP